MKLYALKIFKILKIEAYTIRNI